ncbi:MAG: hypothetical protein AB1489_41885 [Acidobacteriota bacterium]
MADRCDCSLPIDVNTSEIDPSSTYTPVPCPTNQQVGKAIDLLTLKALLAIPLTHLRPIKYRFCSATDCPTVYYSSDGKQVFSEAEVREKVYQKHPTDTDTFVCYCFQHSIKSIKAEIEEKGYSTTTEQISNAIQAGLCACELRNPQGSCCLGNVQIVVQQLEKEISTRTKV